MNSNLAGVLPEIIKMVVQGRGISHAMQMRLVWIPPEGSWLRLMNQPLQPHLFIKNKNKQKKPPKHISYAWHFCNTQTLC